MSQQPDAGGGGHNWILMMFIIFIIIPLRSGRHCKQQQVYLWMLLLLLLLSLVNVIKYDCGVIASTQEPPRILLTSHDSQVIVNFVCIESGAGAVTVR